MSYTITTDKLEENPLVLEQLKGKKREYEKTQTPDWNQDTGNGVNIAGIIVGALVMIGIFRIIVKRKGAK